MKVLTEVGLEDTVNTALRSLRLPEEANEDITQAIMEAWVQYADEAHFKENCFLNELDADPEEVQEALEWYRSLQESDRGRPSKVEKWADAIEDGEATLDDARDDLSDPSFYKLKRSTEKQNPNRA